MTGKILHIKLLAWLLLLTTTLTACETVRSQLQPTPTPELQVPTSTVIPVLTSPSALQVPTTPTVPTATPIRTPTPVAAALIPTSTPAAGAIATSGTAVRPDQAAIVATDDGAELDVPMGAFSDDVVISVEKDADASLPRSGPRLVLMSDVYEMQLKVRAEQTQSLSFKIPYDSADLPTGASAQGLTIVWWNGDHWEEEISVVDEANQVVIGQVDHFSKRALGWSEVKDWFHRTLDPGSVIDDIDTYRHDVFEINYTRNESIFGILGSDHRPPLEDSDPRNGVPDYVERVGKFLSEARSEFNADRAFKGMTIPDDEIIKVFVSDLGYVPDKAGIGKGGPRGEADALGKYMNIDNSLRDVELRYVTAHELFHLWQFSKTWFATGRSHRWWMEATAAWAMDAVYDAVWEKDNPISGIPATSLHYYFNLQESMPNPALSGFGSSINSRPVAQHYAAVSLAKYLESRCEGFVLATFDSDSGMKLFERWETTFGKILKSKCDLEFPDVFKDYMASYYYKWDFDEDVKDLWFVQSSSAQTLASPYIPTRSGMRERVTAALAPLSGRVISFVPAGGNLSPGTLVVKQYESQEPAWVTLYKDRGTIGSRAPALQPAEGIVLVSTPPDEGSVVVENFGGLLTDAEVNHVHVVVTNHVPGRTYSLDLEAYFLEPPRDIKVKELENGNLEVWWNVVQQPVWEGSGHSGIVKAYRIYRLGPGDEEPQTILVDGRRNIDPDRILVEIPAVDVTKNESGVKLLMRTVDKYDNESPDSEPVDVSNEFVYRLTTEIHGADGAITGGYTVPIVREQAVSEGKSEEREVSSCHLSDGVAISSGVSSWLAGSFAGGNRPTISLRDEVVSLHWSSPPAVLLPGESFAFEFARDGAGVDINSFGEFPSGDGYGAANIVLIPNRSPVLGLDFKLSDRETPPEDIDNPYWNRRDQVRLIWASLALDGRILGVNQKVTFTAPEQRFDSFQIEFDVDMGWNECRGRAVYRYEAQTP